MTPMNPFDKLYIRIQPHTRQSSLHPHPKSYEEYHVEPSVVGAAALVDELQARKRRERFRQLNKATREVRPRVEGLPKACRAEALQSATKHRLGVWARF